MATLRQLEAEVKKIQQRNERVEADKTWEISYTRRTLLLVLTYVAIGLYLQVVGISKPWLNAIVPAVGFLLSTLMLPFFKRIWLKWIYKKKI